MYVAHLLYSSVNRHLYCFHILAISNVTMNFGGHISFQISVFFFSLGKYPEKKLLNHMTFLFFIFCGNILFSKVAVPNYNPSNSRQIFPFLHKNNGTLKKSPFREAK